MQHAAPARDPLGWDDVRIFLALVRARTLRAAASELRVDASTVSRRLAALEAALGATLFDRGRDGMAPTKAAEDLMPVAEQIEDGMHRFTRAAEGLEREVKGLVKLSCPPDVAAVVIAPLAREIRARHPGLRLEVQPGEAVVDLARREADIALRTVRPATGELIVTRLASARWVVAARPELARELGPLRAWTDAPWVGFSERLAGIGPARWLARHAPGVDPLVRSESLVVQIAVVATGAAIGLLPEPSLAHYGLVPVALHKTLRAAAAEAPHDQLYLVTHRALRDVPRVRAIWSLLRKRLGDGAA